MDDSQKYQKIFDGFIREKWNKEEILKRKFESVNKATKEVFENIRFVNNYGWNFRLVENKGYSVILADSNSSEKSARIWLSESSFKNLFFCHGKIGLEKLTTDEIRLYVDDLTTVLLKVIANQTDLQKYPTNSAETFD